MSLINSIRPQTGGRSNTESFFGVVQQYDITNEGQSVVVRVLNPDRSLGEERRVALNPNTNYKQTSPKYDRPTIADLTKGKMKTEIGGTIRVENAYSDRNSGTWMARWIGSALKTPDQGVVRIFPEARVGAMVVPEGGKAYRTIDVLDSNKAKPVRTLAELDDAVKAAVSGAHGSAFVRVREINAEGKMGYEGIFVSGGSTTLPAEERVERAMNSKNENFTLLRNALAKADVGADTTVEVVPTFRLFFGSESGTQRSLDALFCTARESGTGSYSKGFTEVLAHFHKYPDSEELFCAGAMTAGSNAQFSRVGASFEVAGDVAGAENVDTAEAGLSGAMPADDDLPPELDLDAAMSAPAEAEPRPASPGVAF